MAELKGNVMGIFKGKIGKISGRVKNGKNYFVSLPAEFNPSMTPEAVARREKFKVTAKLAQLELNHPHPIYLLMCSAGNIDTHVILERSILIHMISAIQIAEV